MDTESKDVVNAILSGAQINDGASSDNGGGEEGHGSDNGGSNGGGDNGGEGGQGGDDSTPYKDEHGEYQFGKVFGQNYNDPNKIKPILERAARLPEIETELEILRTTKSQYEQEIGILKTKPTYKNPSFYKLDKISEESPNELPLYQSFVFGNLTDEALVKADMKQRYPDLANDEENLNLILENEYGAYFDPDADQESKEYKAAAMRLKMKATDLRSGIQARLDKIEVPDTAKMTEQRQAEVTALVTKWKEPFGKIAKEFSKITLSVPDEKDPTKEVAFMTLDIPESERGEYFKLASEHIATSRLSPDNGGADTVASLMRQMYIIRNFPKIIAKVAEEASLTTNGKWRDIIHNTGKRNADTGKQGVSSADLSTQLMEKMRLDNQV